MTPAASSAFLIARLIAEPPQKEADLRERSERVGVLDLGWLKAVRVDETVSKRGHNYATGFIDLDAKQIPAVFVTPGKGKETVAAFKAFLEQH